VEWNTGRYGGVALIPVDVNREAENPKAHGLAPR
jgi:hypothetical protein